MKKSTIFIFIITLSGSLFSQDLNTHYLYQMNWFNINPAYTGEVDGIQAIINPGTQWVGLNGSPTNSMFGLHGAMGNNMGLGSKVVIDKRGIFNNFTAEMTYAYKVNLNESHKLNFGVTAGFLQSSLDQNKILNDKYTDATDPTVTSSYFNQTVFLGSFGALYQFDKLEIGFSVPHLVVSGRPISDHTFGTVKYNFLLQEDKIKVSPLLVYQTLTRSPNQMDVGVRGEWNELAWLQFAYRTNNTMAMALGVNIKNSSFGYLYNINNSPLNTISGGSHEVYISFTFKKDPSNKRVQYATSDGSYIDSEKLKGNLMELKNIQKNENISPELMAELKSIQTDLSEVIHRVKKGDQTKDDDELIHQIENRILSLKEKISGK